MISPRTYASVARVAALVLGAGALGWSASNPERLRVMLGTCTGTYTVCPVGDCSNCKPGLAWSGCEELARELATAGSLLLLAGLPVKRGERG
jgi:hypothetical protein